MCRAGDRAGKCANQLVAEENGRYLRSIRRKRFLCQPSGPPLRWLENRNSAYIEPRRILAFSENAFRWVVGGKIDC